MNRGRLLAAHVRMQALELLRMPAFIVPTVAFPTLFFILFGVSTARNVPAMAAPLMLGYLAFAVIGVTLFQFGVGISADRVSPWERYVRTLGAPLWIRFGARVAVAMLFALAAAAFVAVIASLTTAVRFDAEQWAYVLLALIIGGVPFTLFGLSIGYWTQPKAAVPTANICYLLLSFAGGLWIPPRYLPHFAAQISPFTPTRQFANLLWNALHGISGNAISALALFALLFAAIAAVGYRRDERARYG